ncbi:MAG: GtrA family protein [Oscillospiraceae bacterium]|nr:GtrA family protein [Oscillospiraceae bacterium]
MKRAKRPVLYTLSSLASWAVDTGLFYLLERLFGAALGVAAEPVCNFIARAVSSFFNFNVNRLVFESREKYGRALFRYYCLAIPQLAASTLLQMLFVYLFAVESSEAKTLVKILVDGTLFVASYFIQKHWVFAKKN